ncbi:class I SAM-dependent methyltransferase [Candidatus Kuenenbacteria bacterium]|nr:class I SAM-dependent methyltransferase [Candidatus Kuenenbacteria bacterium]
MDWKGYSKKFYDNPEQIMELENQFLTELINDALPQGKKCLDIGCGLGHWTQILHSLGGNVTGADNSQDVTEQFQTRLPDVKFVLLDQSTLPFPDDEFEIILISWVLQEMIDHEKFSIFLAEVKRILAPGGRFILAENIYPSDRILLTQSPQGNLFENKKGSPTKLRFFLHNSLAKIMKNYGLSLLQKQIVGHTFFEVYKK